MAKKKLSGKEAFEQYYSELYGDRWPILKDSFALESRYFEYKIDGYKSYFLDCASVIAAICLPLNNASKILDLCAAPGGKTLVLASRMEENAKLISNERSAERRNRLLDVISESLPDSINKRISVTPFDGSLACKKYDEAFDAILLDAPCSSERHVYASPKYLDLWTSSRIKNLSFTQWSLLSSAYLVLKDEGFLLYSTCAIAEDENDSVIKKLLKKYDSAKNVEIDFDKIYESFAENALFKNGIPHLQIEKTQFGYQILPDKNDGAGPIYFSLIRKKLILDN
ncbi:MAG: RsmB/NOP family class I SAM-dependent RNA methyltransferase [Treponemataceae bacterium]|nr:RsmB/NOP family class I SAM-dependent RNA methyltransferase [Spirochaetales bacterium]MDY6031363.1 RsmB/NOP family class I SAM-dependent RNA methyltransferase [Treponemataceae bacterium]